MQSSLGAPQEYVVPPPLLGPDQCTRKEVEKRHANAVLLKTRKLSPRSRVFVELYEQAIDRALKTKTESNRRRELERVHRYEAFFKSSPILLRVNDKLTEQLEEELIRLRQLEYYCKYGDYLALEVRTIREAAKSFEFDAETTLTLDGYWTGVHAGLQQDIATYKRILKSKQSVGENDISLLRAIWKIAGSTGIVEERLIWTIEHYAERNDRTHGNINKFIMQREWNELAKQIQSDLNDLPMVIPPNQPQDLRNMTTIIETLRDEMFDIKPDQMDQYQTWRYKDEAERHGERLRALKGKDFNSRRTRRGGKAESSREA